MSGGGIWETMELADGSLKFLVVGWVAIKNAILYPHIYDNMQT